MGSLTSRPNMRKNGEYPVVLCTLLLYARHNLLKYKSQSEGCSIEQVESMFSSVLLSHSTNPSDCGWYGVVLVFSICRNWHNWVAYNYYNWLTDWCESITPLGEYIVISFAAITFGKTCMQHIS